MRLRPLAVATIAAGLLASSVAAADEIVVRNAVGGVFMVSLFNVDDPFGVSGIPCAELTIGTGAAASFARSGLCGAYQRMSVRVVTFRFEGSGPPGCEYRGLDWGQGVTITGNSAAVSCVLTN